MLGLTTGKADGTFAPDENITRAQMATFLIRLWQDTLRKTCPTTTTPFTDITGNFAQQHITCLYALGITKGATSTTFEPDTTLTTSQITRFLARLLNKATPNTCDLTNNELAKAAQCLTSLNIAPNTAEAQSSTQASRAQMIVYLIGTWHNTSGRGQPPTPPTLPTTQTPTTTTTLPTTTTTQAPTTTTPQTTTPDLTRTLAEGCVQGTKYVVCEYTNSSEQAPAGEYVAVSAGAWHSCGIKTDKTAVCWDNDNNGQAQAPAGEYVAVSAGAWHSCGIKTDKTAVCWGNDNNGQAQAPAGEYVAVSAGAWHSCGIKTDKTAVCWGNNVWKQTEVVAGQYTAIDSYEKHTCGLKTDGNISCWGDNGWKQTEVVAGQYTAVTTSGSYGCGLTPEGTITCWGEYAFFGLAATEDGSAVIQEGPFTAIDAGGWHMCGIKTDKTVTCWDLT